MKPRTTSRRYAWRVREATRSTGMSAACSRRSARRPARLQESSRLRQAAAAPGRCRRWRAGRPRTRGRWLSSFTSDGEADERDHQRAAVADLLEAAAVAGQRVAFDGDEQFVRLQRGLAGAGDELRSSGILRRAILPLRRDASSTTASCAISGGMASAGRRGVDDVAADGGRLADLVVGEPHRAPRHGGQRRAERGIVEEALDRRGRAEPHARRRRRAAH